MFENFGARELIWLVLSFLLPVSFVYYYCFDHIFQPLAVFIREDDLNVHVCISLVLLFIFW